MQIRKAPENYRSPQLPKAADRQHLSKSTLWAKKRSWIPAKGPYLIVGAAEATTDEFLTYDLPDADQTCDWVINNNSYTIQLMNDGKVIDSVTAGDTRVKGYYNDAGSLKLELAGRHNSGAMNADGSVMVYDITDPANAEFVNYINSREFDDVIQGDVSPEGLCFVPASDSKNSKAMFLAACEVSGTMAVYQCDSVRSSVFPADFPVIQDPQKPEKNPTKDEIISELSNLDLIARSSVVKRNHGILYQYQRSEERNQILLQGTRLCIC